MLFNFLKCWGCKTPKKREHKHEYSYDGGRTIYDKIEYLFSCKECGNDMWIPREDIVDIFDQGIKCIEHNNKSVSIPKDKLIETAKELTINYYSLMGIDITKIEGGFDNLINDYCLYLEVRETER